MTLLRLVALKLSGFTLEWISPALMTHVNCALALLKQGQVHLGKGIGIILLLLTGLAELKHLRRHIDSPWLCEDRGRSYWAVAFG